MRKLIVIIGVGVAVFSNGSIAQAQKTVECYCTDSAGARVELGQLRCMTVGGRLFMARCEMSLNVPMWRELPGDCLSS